jgi:plasmid stabilization system protein ParE
MLKHELAQKARTDLSAIGRYTKKKWGEAQTERYLAQLEDDFELLAIRPELGRLAEPSDGQLCADSSQEVMWSFTKRSTAAF